MRLPNSRQRTLVIGRTGSGKTVAAVWHLSNANFLSQPWIVFNHKQDDLVNSIPGAQFVGLDELPKKPGIYIYSPMPDKDDEAVDELLWRIHARGKTGIYIDEGYMIPPRSPALNAAYTQGRSKQIPMITLSQRPSRISRFAISESDFFQVFHLVDERDHDTVKGFISIPRGVKFGEINDALPKHHSMYYDVAQKKLEILSPVPDEEIILQSFEDRFNLSKKKNRLI